MAKLKTTPTRKSPLEFVNAIEDEQKRKDSLAILELMKKVTGKKPELWSTNIVSFDRYHYKYASGREGDWFVTGFSPRKQSLTLYIMPGLKCYDKLMAKLGKHKIGKSCLYIKRLTDVDTAVLKELVVASVDHMRKING